MMKQAIQTLKDAHAHALRARDGALSQIKHLEFQMQKAIADRKAAEKAVVEIEEGLKKLTGPLDAPAKSQQPSS